MFALFLGTILQFLLLTISTTSAQNQLVATSQGEINNLTIQFSEKTIFYDLSQYNYWAGVNITYEYVLKARPDRQVYIYFYTPLTGNAIVELFDGISDAGAKFNLSKVDVDVSKPFYNPPFAKSKSGSLFIRIKAFNQNNKSAAQDFQALATDYVNPVGCDALVVASQQEQTVTEYNFFAAALPGTECLHIFHATDVSNNPMKTINIQSSSGNYTVFKGLTMYYTTQLPTNVASPIYAFDKHIIIKHTKGVQIKTAWVIQEDNSMNMMLDSNTPVMIMSPDYYAYYMLPYMGKQLKEQFVIQPVKGQNIGAEVSITMLFGTGIVQISAVNGQVQTLLLTLNNIRNFPYVYKYEHTFDKLLVTYMNNVTDRNSAYGSGVFGTVKPGGVQKGSNSCSLIVSVLIMLCIKLF